LKQGQTALAHDVESRPIEAGGDDRSIDDDDAMVAENLSTAADYASRTRLHGNGLRCQCLRAKLN